MADIYYVVIYCSVLQYSALAHSNSRGGGGVISSLCTVWGPWGNTPTHWPVDAPSRNWIWEVWGEYLYSATIPEQEQCQYRNSTVDTMSIYI